MSANISKRNSVPSRIVSPQEKLDAIHRVQNGETKAAVARDIGVPESTLRGWCKNEGKITYLLKQPGRPESLEPISKIPKLDFNVSVNDYNYGTTRVNTETPLNLNNSPKFTNNLSEREKTQAELSKLGLELGLNIPEMVLPNLNNSTDAVTNNLLLAHWNALLHQQIKYKTENSSISNSTNINSLGNTNERSILTKDTNSLKNRVATPNLIQFQNGLMHPPNSKNDSVANNVGTSANLNMNQVNSDQNSWFWKWYQQKTDNEQETNTILYQQLTKQPQDGITSNEQIARNLCIRDISNKPDKTGIKCRSVLDNLFNNDNLPFNKEETEENTLSHQEAIQHGEKFLKWLEAHSGPSFTAIQIMQFKTLLNNVKSGIDKKKCDIIHKSKVKRK